MGTQAEVSKTEAAMILRAGGMTSVKETRCQGCLAGVGATLQTSDEAVGEKEKYPVSRFFSSAISLSSSHWSILTRGQLARETGKWVGNRRAGNRSESK